MNRRAVLSVAGLVVVLGLASAGRVEANSCVGISPTIGRAWRGDVFLGTIVDQRFTFARRGVLVFPQLEYEVATTMVWKGPASPRMFFIGDGRMDTSLRPGVTALFYTNPPRYEFDASIISCFGTTVFVRYAGYLGALGEPIATFPASAPPVPASPGSWSRRARAMWVLGITRYTSLEMLMNSPFFLHDWAFAIVLTPQILAALWFLWRRQFRRSLGLTMTAAATTIVTLLWIGHSILKVEYDTLNQFL